MHCIYRNVCLLTGTIITQTILKLVPLHRLSLTIHRIYLSTIFLITFNHPTTASISQIFIIYWSPALKIMRTIQDAFWIAMHRMPP
ncbi:hypothetical protein CLU79DRAFT_770344 [Phycomyces nitens]|nr:hypothetical protein CLU79DRAFT_770344 [Phycomyces nitens]